MNLVAEGKRRPVSYATLPLEKAAEAHRVVRSLEIFGKVVLLPRGEHANSVRSQPKLRA